MKQMEFNKLEIGGQCPLEYVGATIGRLRAADRRPYKIDSKTVKKIGIYLCFLASKEIPLIIIEKIVKNHKSIDNVGITSSNALSSPIIAQ